VSESAVTARWTHPISSVRASSGFSALLVILFLTFLDNTVISAVLSNVQSELHAGVTQLQWVVGGYALAFASLMLICGALGDAYGRKKVMLIGVAIFCAGSVLCALATSTEVLIAGRMVMGAGAAASEPGTLSMIRHLYVDHRARARALGAWSAVTGLALAIGPVLGGVLNGIFNWRAIFWFNVVLGLVAWFVGSEALPESADPTASRPDFLGFVLAALSLGMATYATISGETAGYRASSVVTLYVLSGVALVAFVVVERVVRAPMVPLSFFRRPAFAGSTFIALTSYFSILSIFFFVALYLEIVASAGAYQLAQDFIPLLVGMVSASMLSGRWVAQSGARAPMTIGCLVAAVGVVMTDHFISPHAGLSTVGWTMGVAGVGFGILIVPVTSAALSSVPPEHSGVAASVTNTSRELGAVAGVAILGSVVNGQLTVNLMHRLAQLGIPPMYREMVINAVTTGTVAQQRKALGPVGPALQKIIDHVVGAAYQAFTHGVNLALGAATVLLVASAAVAYVTGSDAVETPS
jgi:EmrB/QacA subfamily drug resistance transporter